MPHLIRCAEMLDDIYTGEQKWGRLECTVCKVLCKGSVGKQAVDKWGHDANDYGFINVQNKGNGFQGNRSNVKHTIRLFQADAYNINCLILKPLSLSEIMK